MIPGKKDASADLWPKQCAEMLRDYISARGMRHTPERHKVLDIILSLENIFSVNDIANFAKEQHICISKGTIANTLRILAELSIVLPAGTSRRTLLYRVAPHNARIARSTRIPFTLQLQCSVCGSLKKVRAQSAVESLASRRFSSFAPTCGVITIYGRCNKCAALNTANKPKR